MKFSHPETTEEKRSLLEYHAFPGLSSKKHEVRHPVIWIMQY
jgi:hypothetical protein